MTPLVLIIYVPLENHVDLYTTIHSNNLVFLLSQF